jgi:hypothetical protein
MCIYLKYLHLKKVEEFALRVCGASTEHRTLRAPVSGSDQRRTAQIDCSASVEQHELQLPGRSSMTAGDMIQPPGRTVFARDRLIRGRHRISARPQNLRVAILLVGLTFIWLTVIWMAVFGSRPHTYLLILVGTYTIGVLSGSGLTSVLGRRERRAARPVSVRVDEPIDAEVRPVR